MILSTHTDTHTTHCLSQFWTLLDIAIVTVSQT